ncbi:MAG: ABC transporter substrate-binding protein [Coriobacteriia bacterium]|nr:ABC transporter substrate-binding protein [Coriobacteriia bacterium]
MSRSRSKRVIAGILALVLVSTLLLTACGNVAPGSKESVETKEVTDCIGRTVTVPKDPQRVVCLYASTAHMMALLGKERLIVGSPDGVRRDILMQHKYPGITSIAVPYVEGINIDELARIEADVALVRRNIAEDPATAEKLEKLGIPYVTVDYYSIDELRTAISVVGAVFDEEEKAQAYLDFLDETLFMVKARTKDIPATEKKRVYHAINEATRTDAYGDLCWEITTDAGLINVSTEDGSTFSSEDGYITLEQIYAWNPEHIVANDFNARRYMLTDSKWSGLDAVANKRVYTLPVGVSRWCHKGSMEPHMAALFLGRQFYPELFSDIDLAQYTKDYYQRFFDLDLSDEEISAVLSGEGMRLPKETQGKQDQ